MSQHKGIGPLINNKLFDGVKESSINLSIHQNNFLSFREGDVIFQTNDNSENIFLVVDGEVKLKIPNAYGSSVVHQKVKNDFFGEIELVDKSPRKTSAVAETDCIIYILSRKELYEIFSDNKAIKRNIFPNEIDEETEDENLDNEVLNPDKNKLEELPELQTNEGQQFDNSINQNDEINYELENPTSDDIKINELSDPLLEEEKLINEGKEILNEENSFIYSNKLADEINFSSNSHKEETEFSEDFNKEEILSSMEENIENDFLDNQELNNPPNIIEPDSNENKLDYQKILELVRKIYQQSNLEETVHSITGVLFDLFDSQIAQVFLVDKDKNELWSFPFMDNSNEIRRLKVGEGLLSNCASTGQIINLINPSVDQIFNKQIDSIEYVDDEDLLLYPVKNNSGEIICIIQLINSGKGGFTKNDEEILSEISKDISAVVENFSLREQNFEKEEQKEFQQQNESIVYEKTFLDEILNWNKAVNFLIEDLKSLFSLVKRYADFIKRKSEINEIKEASEFIKGQANSAIKYSELIIEYLNGKFSFNKEVMNLNSTLDELLAMLAEYVESKNVKLYKKYDSNVFIKADRLAFYFVCFQLTKNACEAMTAGGNIYIITNQQNEFITIEFRDTGKGIEKEIQEKIFEPYSSFGKENKAGLGLSIASKIINEHDGKIELGPLSMEGASIIIQLPIIKMD